MPSHANLLVLPDYQCVDKKGARWLWEVFSQSCVYSFLGAELQRKISAITKVLTKQTKDLLLLLKKKVKNVIYIGLFS